MFDVDTDATPDFLEHRLLAGEMLIAQVRARQAEMFRAADSAQVHTREGAASIQEWVRGRLDVSDSTARDLVALSKALAEEHHIRAMANTGESFDRMVTTAGLIAAGADAATVERSRSHDLAGVNRLRNRQRCTTRSTETQAFLNRYLTLQDSLDGTRGLIYSELPGYECSIVAKALVERADTLNDLPGPNLGRPQRMADALVTIAQDSLGGTEGSVSFAAGGDGSGRSDPW